MASNATAKCAEWVVFPLPPLRQENTTVLMLPPRSLDTYLGNYLGKNIEI
jgi:hypothetical protein